MNIAQQSNTHIGSSNLPDIDTDFNAWYNTVICEADLIDYHDVSGCYVLRSSSYAMWEQIKSNIDNKLKDMDVKNTYFPLFVKKENLEKEKDHIADFSPEVAWITKAGKSDLEEPIAIRPTSETIIYPYFAKWLKKDGYSALPYKFNQWANVVRWEFKHPIPFIRTREFLWQEGHTAYSNKEDADNEVYKIIKLYEHIYKDVLAVPCIGGHKSKKEQFAGADYTTTVEIIIPKSGKAIQGATSHSLGQNFSKMFEISYEDKDKNKQYVWQNSWGFTTRSIGVAIMVHGDKKGLIIPPRISEYQIVIVPCGITNKLKNNKEKKQMLDNYISIIFNKLKENKIRVDASKHPSPLESVAASNHQSPRMRVYLDDRQNYSPGNKFNYWELRGIPIRLEIGPIDAINNTAVIYRRDKDSKEIIQFKDNLDDLCDVMISLLDDIHNVMLHNASIEMNKSITNVSTFYELPNKQIAQCTWCGEIECEENIKNEHGHKSLCIPFDQQNFQKNNCINYFFCKNIAKYNALFGKSY